MHRIAITVIASSLIIGGCTTIQPSSSDKASTVKTDIVKTEVAKNRATGELDLVEVQDQLARFVDIIELLAKSKHPQPATDDKANGIPIDINAAISQKKASRPSADTQQLTDIVNSINSNLEKLGKAQNETQSIRQLLAIADQYTDNKQNLFSGLFEILTRETNSEQ